eukprot:m.89897 g.89897  ORF g.89897 m.89897 type:complete len:253 (-) comp13246_c0_seq4:98-856(-)
MGCTIGRSFQLVRLASDQVPSWPHVMTFLLLLMEREACTNFPICFRFINPKVILGHAAMPNMCIDPVLVASHLVTMLQSLISRNQDPFDPAVISVSQISAGTATNIIPDKAIIKGTVRTFHERTRARLLSDIENMATSVSTAFGASLPNCEIHQGFPVTINEDRCTVHAAQAASSVVGEHNVIHDVSPTGGAEDFAFMLQHRPGCYAFIGQGEAGYDQALHSPLYNFNDSIIATGASWYVRLAEGRMPIKSS